MARGDQLIMGNLMGRNFGDDLMLHGFLREDRPEGRRVVLCQVMPTTTAELPPGVDVQPLSVRALVGAARGGGNVVVAGGTQMQYLRSHPRVPQYLVLVKWLCVYLVLRLVGSKLEMRSVGMSPFESRPSALLARMCCRLQSRITVRDPVSLDMIVGWGIQAEHEEDLALPYLRWWAAGRGADTDEQAPYTVLAPAFANFHLEWWVEQVRRTVPLGEHLVLFASGRQSSGSDDTVNRELAAALGTDYPCSFHSFEGETAESLRVIAGAARVIAARYHVVLTARFFEREIIADVYHPKVNDALTYGPADSA